MRKQKRKFVIIAKTDTGIYLKFKTNNIVNTIEFLKNKYKIYFANIYVNTGDTNGTLVYTYGKNKGWKLPSLNNNI